MIAEEASERKMRSNTDPTGLVPGPVRAPSGTLRQELDAIGMHLIEVEFVQADGTNRPDLCQDRQQVEARCFWGRLLEPLQARAYLTGGHDQ